MKLNLKVPLCFFDLETTGTNVQSDRIVEIAVLKMMPSGEIIRKHNLINPGIPIPAESTAVHRITNEDVLGKPTFREVAKEYAKFLEGCDLSGFNILKFDVPLLVEEFIRAEVEFDYSRKKIIDSQRIFHLMEKRNLSAALKFYCGTILSDAHSAEADAQAAMDVLCSQVERYNNMEVTDGMGDAIGKIENDMQTLGALATSGMVDLAGRMILDQHGEAIFNFGKHRLKQVTRVLKEEPSYYEWMMNGDFSLDTKRKLTEIKLKMAR
jgi:DNA polymerase-3 subunit epsilon